MITDCQMPDVDGFMLARRVRRERRFAQMPIVMLTSVGQSDDLARRHRNDVDALLTKPVKHSDLLEALGRLFGVATKDGRTEPTADRIGSRPARRLRVLVAEDNPVNRKLVTTLLKKRGHAVKAVENGREAVTAVASHSGAPFDVVLMDLQMPEMGGLEAAREIRNQEIHGAGRLPLVALTAHAMQGDRAGWISLKTDRRRRADRRRRTIRRRRFGRPPPGRRAGAERRDLRRDRRAVVHRWGPPAPKGGRPSLSSGLSLVSAQDRAGAPRTRSGGASAGCTPAQGIDCDRRCAGGAAGRRGARRDGARAGFRSGPDRVREAA